MFTLPFMVRSVMAVFAAIDVKTLDESASSLGASPWRRFLDVIVPNARPGILAGSLMVVTLSLGEFNLTWMLHTPLTKTLPVGLADSYASMRLEVASAYTLVFFIMIIPLLIGDADLRRHPRRGARRAVMSTQGNIMASRCGIEACGKTFADGTRALEPVTLACRARRDFGPARPLGLRQDHAACGSSPGSRRPMPAAGLLSTTLT